MKSESLPPHAPTLMESTRAIGYTLESAIADIIDNSIAASASSVEIFFFPIGEAYVAILDDGRGMDSVGIKTAMRYGSQSPNDERGADDLGRFGLGLKTASLSQCRVLTVVSKQNNHIEARQWDIDFVSKSEEWSLIILDQQAEIDALPQIEKLKELDSGTLVIWQNLDRMKIGEINFERAMGKKMDDVRAHLSLVFHRYISGEIGLKKLRINMNSVPIESADPFLMHRNTQIMADEDLYIGSVKVVVRPFILPHISALSAKEMDALGGKEGLRKSQGFYVYRNKRLLIWGTWFRMMRKGELSKLARIQVDIPNELDALWTLDIKKSTAIPPEAVRNNLESVVDRISERSKQTWVFRGRKETDDSLIHIWNRFKGRQGGFFYSINRDHPLVEMFANTPPQIKSNLETLLKSIESGIPLNQLYVDLTSERQVENETETTIQEVESIIRALLGQMPTSAAKTGLLERLSVSDPFINYPELIERYKTGGLANGSK